LTEAESPWVARRNRRQRPAWEPARAMFRNSLAARLERRGLGPAEQGACLPVTVAVAALASGLAQ
jgi:hypothetical protein